MRSNHEVPISILLPTGRRLSLWVIAVRLQLDQSLPHRIPLVGPNGLSLKLPGELQRQLGLTVQLDADAEPQLRGWVYLLRALYSRELLMRAQPEELFSVLIQAEMAVQGVVDDFPVLDVSDDLALSDGAPSGWQIYYLAFVSMHRDGLHRVQPTESEQFRQIAGRWIATSLNAVMTDRSSLEVSIAPVPTLLSPGRSD